MKFFNFRKNNEMENVLIAGANGGTGRELIDILHVKDNFRPVAMVRKEEQIEHFEKLGIKTVLADLEDDLDKALEDIDRVIFVAGSGSSTGKEKTLSVDRDGAEELIDAAKKKGVKKFVMLSAMGADDPDENSEMYIYMRSKHEADEHLKFSGLDYTIIRAGALTDKPASGNIKVAKKLEEQGEIPRHDVAQVLTYCLEDEMLKNKIVEVIEGDKAIRPELQGLSKQ